MIGLKKLKSLGKNVAKIAAKTVPGGGVAEMAVDAAKGNKQPDDDMPRLMLDFTRLEQRVEALEKKAKEWEFTLQNDIDTIIPFTVSRDNEIKEQIDALVKNMEKAAKENPLDKVDWERITKKAAEEQEKVIKKSEKAEPTPGQSEESLEQLRDTLNNGLRERAVPLIIKHEAFSEYPYYDMAVDKRGNTRQIVIIDGKYHPAHFINPPQGKELIPIHGMQFEKTDNPHVLRIDKTDWDVSKATITHGYGSLCEKDAKPITREEAKERLVGHLSANDCLLLGALRECDAVRELYPPLAEFMYNVGFDVLERKQPEKIYKKPAPTAVIPDTLHTMHNPYKMRSIDDLLRTTDIRGICNIISWFRKAGGIRSQGLISRRNDTIQEMVKGMQQLSEREAEPDTKE